MTLGIPGMIAVSSIMRCLLYGIAPGDLLSLASLSLLVLAATLGATAVPAWRAARTATAALLGSD
jgi:hypothetical protein